MDADKDSHQKVLGFFDIDPDETPAFVIHNTENDNVHGFRNMQESDWNWKKLDNILEGARRENKYIISEGDNHERTLKYYFPQKLCAQWLVIFVATSSIAHRKFNFYVLTFLMISKKKLAHLSRYTRGVETCTHAKMHKNFSATTNSKFAL